MSLVQEISNGEVVSDKTATSSSTTSNSTDSTKEMFLQLLVTEMQYQDPLEPTDNSQYVQQMATFSQVEALNSVSENVTQIQASSLVGNYVTITTDDGTTLEGCVDYVTTDSDEIKVSVEGELYDIDTVSAVQDSAYYEANVYASTFAALVAQLPSTTDVTSADATAVANARTLYDSLSAYQKTFISESDLATLTALETKLGSLTASATDSTTESTTESTADTTTE
ncbi:MAG: flagellar hook capping protein [Lachnospiraceae bacterium]|nr:flagellar hook capping protein [Lachnospiraceae bacterium]